MIHTVLLHPAGSDCFLLESIFESEVWDFMCSPVSESNEAAVCQAMMEGAKEALAGYCSTIDEDLMIIRDGQVAAGSRAEVAVKVGVGYGSAFTVSAVYRATLCSCSQDNM